MPIREFRCSSCGNVFEELIMHSAEMEELTCPKCGTPKVEQLMSSFAITSSAAPAPAGCPQSASCGESGGFS